MVEFVSRHQHWLTPLIHTAETSSRKLVVVVQM